MRLANKQDNWYTAGQGTPFGLTPAGNDEKSIGGEIDVVYTLFFTPGNHVAWQIGGGVWLPGDYVDGNAVAAATAFGRNSGNASTESWGYTQLWINF